MHTLTMNMFAETNEDMVNGAAGDLAKLPLIAATREEQPEYTEDGMDGYYKGCTIRINLTTGGMYRVQVEKGTRRAWTTYENTLEDAHHFAKITGDFDERIPA